MYSTPWCTTRVLCTIVRCAYYPKYNTYCQLTVYYTIVQGIVHGNYVRVAERPFLPEKKREPGTMFAPALELSVVPPASSEVQSPHACPVPTRLSPRCVECAASHPSICSPWAPRSMTLSNWKRVRRATSSVRLCSPGHVLVPNKARSAWLHSHVGRSLFLRARPSQHIEWTEEAP